MGKYNFFLEFDGKKTNSKAYDAPVDQIMATSITQALERFCKRKGLECSMYEALSQNTFRSYLLKKAFLKPDTEQVYYIESN
jgi:hypothetical protein